MPEFELRPFDASAFPDGPSGYLIDGRPVPWNEIEDPSYAKIEHLMVVGPDGKARFPKINVIWNRGVFVTTARVHPERGVEVLIIDEERPLVRDESGNRGHVKITSIPQGIIRKDETYSEAAIRIVNKETGHTPSGMTYLGEVYLDAANSETPHDFCLAQVPFEQVASQPTHDETEIIENQRWLTLSEIERMEPPLSCAKALSGIQLSRPHLPELLQANEERLLGRG